MRKPQPVTPPLHNLLASILLLSWAMASVAYAQGGSPYQVEFTAPPVPPGPTVNDFTGDFTYGLPILTVPGPNGSSYSMTLSYTAGTNPNDDVSWVGYGWSLNPGAIVRNQRGFADDWKGEVTMYNKRPVDFIVSSERSIVGEIGSGDLFETEIGPISINLGVSETIRWDSRSGFGELIGVHSGVSALGNYAGLRHMSDNGEGSLSAVLSVNPLAIAANRIASANNEGIGSDVQNSSGFRALTTASKLYGSTTFTLSLAGNNDFEMSPPAQMPITGRSENLAGRFGISGTPSIMMGADFGISDNLLEIEYISEQPFDAFGYMHSVEAATAPNKWALMDYYYEKDVPFVMDDEFLPIPFSGADIFSVVGGGSFRLYNRGVGGFRQNFQQSNFLVDNDEVSHDGGTVIGYGWRTSSGEIIYESGEWTDPEAPIEHGWITSGDEPWFFRYIGERSGTLLYDDSDDPVNAWITTDGGVLDWVTDFLGINDEPRYPSLNPSYRLQLNDWDRPYRTGYIGYSTNAEMLLQKNGTYYRSYLRDADTRSLFSNRDAFPDAIGEFALYGAGGQRYVYGLPLYSLGETSMNLGLRDIMVDSSVNVHHGVRAYSYVDPFTVSIKTGQQIQDPIAKMFLLTTITTPDYVDLWGDGPDNEDLGGWVQFKYDLVAGNYEKGSRGSGHVWRQPYNGMSYSAGELSDPTDDMGSVSMGNREAYYSAAH